MAARFLVYSPDSYGLGHVRRAITLSRAIPRRFRGSSTLLLTGAPRAHYFDYPDSCDYVKLPAITKDSLGRYTSRELDIPLDQIIRIRTSLIQETTALFDPHLVLVDHAPTGLCGEVLPTLARLSAGGRGKVRVLGLRDIIDEPDAVRAAWERDGVIDVMRRHFDHILVYGRREIFDPIAAYGIPPDVEEKMTFVGYLSGAESGEDPAELHARYAPRTGRLVVITLGGGGDGNVVLKRFFEMYRKLGAAPPFEVLAVAGPLMSPRKRERFHAAAVPGLTMVDYVKDLPALLQAADFAVSMGGYNTVCEMAQAGVGSLIVPRSFPRKEQLLRASLLARRGLARCLPLEEATPKALRREVLDGLGRPRPGRWPGLGLKGEVEAVALFGDLLGDHVIGRHRRAARSSRRQPAVAVLKTPSRGAVPCGIRRGGS